MAKLFQPGKEIDRTGPQMIRQVFVAELSTPACQAEQLAEPVPK